jgi:NDP-sugar pyrophosphorylase family protein
MNNSVIGDNTIIKDSVIGNNVKIAANCVLTGCVVGDNITIESGKNLTEQKIDS